MKFKYLGHEMVVVSHITRPKEGQVYSVVAEFATTEGIGRYPIYSPDFLDLVTNVRLKKVKPDEDKPTHSH